MVLTGLFLLFSYIYGSVEEAVPVVAGYSLGCSMIALFARVGGGIYTKAADVGADLVGKVEAGIPEDDPRNPAVIADNVGDNVGDIAGMGSDLNESYVGSLVSCIALGLTVVINGESFGMQATLFPFVIAGAGIIAAVLAQGFVRMRKWENPQRALNIATYVATIIELLSAMAASLWLFGTTGPFFSVATGLIVGMLLGKIAEIYTSEDYRKVREIASESETGHATNIISGFSVGHGIDGFNGYCFSFRNYISLLIYRDVWYRFRCCRNVVHLRYYRFCRRLWSNFRQRWWYCRNVRFRPRCS